MNNSDSNYNDSYGNLEIAEKLEIALELYRKPQKITDRDFVERIEAILPFLPQPRQIMATRYWIFTGLVMVVSLLAVPFGADYQLFRSFFGAGYSLSLALVMSLFLASYCALYVSSHIRELAKRFHLESNGQLYDKP